MDEIKDILSNFDKMSIDEKLKLIISAIMLSNNQTVQDKIKRTSDLIISSHDNTIEQAKKSLEKKGQTISEEECQFKGRCDYKKDKLHKD